MTNEFTLEIELPNHKELVQIPVTIDSHWENDGIGAYEFWGAKGYDRGTDYVEIDEIKWNKKDFTKEEIKLIDAAIDENMENWCVRIEENYESEYDYPEPEYEEYY